MAIRWAINGAAGRMGQRLIALAGADKDFELVAALEHAGYPRLGDDAGTIAGIGPIGIPLTAALNQPVDVLIDFSVPKATGAILAACLERRTPLVVATTGLEADTQSKIRAG